MNNEQTGIDPALLKRLPVQYRLNPSATAQAIRAMNAFVDAMGQYVRDVGAGLVAMKPRFQVVADLLVEARREQAEAEQSAAEAGVSRV